MIPIVPAIIPKTADEVRVFALGLSFSSELHLDVVDGQYVRHVSWPYEPAGSPREIKQYTDVYTLEVDLMVKDPLTAADAWLAAGADMLVFHTDTISVEAFARFIETAKISIGIAATNDTPLSELIPYLKFADYVQLMGIARIGAQGQPFDERVLDRIRELKQSFPNTPITIDGSVNVETITRLAEAGADRFICGSAIVAAVDPRATHAALSALIN
jgi:ribulose-phosphate 3-epimerase